MGKRTVPLQRAHTLTGPSRWHIVNKQLKYEKKNTKVVQYIINEDFSFN